MTGGASGIGAATVARLRRDGMRVAALDLAASSGADVQLARAMADDHAAEGIRVNCVCPGPTTTPLLEEYFALAPDPARERRRYEEAQVHGRLIEPEEIADAIAYLASPQAASTIGAALVVDGGYSIR